MLVFISLLNKFGSSKAAILEDCSILSNNPKVKDLNPEYIFTKKC